jgi:hypothetical protein
MDPVQRAAALAAAVVIASMLSVELGISVALLELGLGVVVGNLFDLNADTPWLMFAGRHVARHRPPLGHAGDRCRPTRDPRAGLCACCPMDAGVPGGPGQALAPDDR